MMFFAFLYVFVSICVASSALKGQGRHYRQTCWHYFYTSYVIRFICSSNSRNMTIFNNKLVKQTFKIYALITTEKPHTEYVPVAADCLVGYTQTSRSRYWVAFTQLESGTPSNFIRHWTKSRWMISHHQKNAIFVYWLAHRTLNELNLCTSICITYYIVY